MLNEKNERELAYVIAIDDIQPIPNYDRVELATVGGWHIIVQKGQFKVGDKAVYIEVDSRVPIKEPFLFLEKRNYKVKTLKMCKCISQGLLMSFSDFGWEEDTHQVGDFLTKELGITYYEAGDNNRKAPSANKYDKMKQRHKKLFKSPIVKNIMKFKIGREIMFFFFGKKRDKKSAFPAWVKKTDEERVQNMPFLFSDPDKDKKIWMVTEKIDGSSSTFTLRKTKFNRFDYRVCSRNVCFDKPNKKCFYETNVYLEIAERYNMRERLEKLFNMAKSYTNKDIEYVTIQGEIYGKNIQRRTYNMDSTDLAVFNVIYGDKNGNEVRANPEMMKTLMDELGLPTVPILDTNFILPNSCDELLAYAESENSKIDGGMREGIVLRGTNGVQSFKAVSNKFLLKYHS